MNRLNQTLENLEKCFPDDFTEQEISLAKTLFYKELSLTMHKFYNSKMS